MNCESAVCISNRVAMSVKYGELQKEVEKSSKFLHLFKVMFTLYQVNHHQATIWESVVLPFPSISSKSIIYEC